MTPHPRTNKHSATPRGNPEWHGGEEGEKERKKQRDKRENDVKVIWWDLVTHSKENKDLFRMVEREIETESVRDGVTFFVKVQPMKYEIYFSFNGERGNVKVDY